MRPIRWTAKPLSSRKATVVVRTGTDAFIRGPNDSQPQHRYFSNAGGDMLGPIGSFYSPTGLRYLIRFDIPGAFKSAGISMEDFELDEAILVLRLFPFPDAREDVPIVVFPLTRGFLEGEGKWGLHRRTEKGCSWLMATDLLPWEKAGGDFSEFPYGEGILPRSGGDEVEIDVTKILAEKFAKYQAEGIWDDPGMIIMRDPKKGGKCLYRMIYSFQAQPSTDIVGSERKVLSPELYLR